MNGSIIINNKKPLDIILNGKSILAIMFNNAKVYPSIEDITDNIDFDIAVSLSCFGTGIWLDDFNWNDNSVWTD